MARIGFLADDLTGAADVLAQAHAHGLDAALTLDLSAPLAAAADVVGIAGPARSLAGTALDTALRAGFSGLARESLDILLYKVCSTFDSTPSVGSIGKGIEVLTDMWPEHGGIPVVPAQPEFGRYTAFSQHFGRYDGAVYRLDRHPVMSVHPTTPMSESDMRCVLAAQLSGTVDPGAFHLPAYEDGKFLARWESARAAAHSFVVDAVTPAQMDVVADALLAERGTSIAVGSGGIMAALARARGRAPISPAPTRASGPTLAVSASASATTAAQISDAVDHGWVDHGWVEVAIPSEALRPGEPWGIWLANTAAALAAGHNVVAHTLRGGDDPRMTVRRVGAEAVGRTIGAAAGIMIGRGLSRDIAVFGGDSSSHALLALGVAKLRVSEQFVTAGPICRTDGESRTAGCWLLLKGGQVGPVDILRRFSGDVKNLAGEPV